MKKKRNKDIKQIYYKDYIFHFKYETNPVTGNYEPHITVRRNLTIEDALNTYFSIAEPVYNEENSRWEGYSSKTKPGLQYEQIDINNFTI